MKLPKESKEWHKVGDGRWKRTTKVKKRQGKNASGLYHRMYCEIICGHCGGLGLARKSEIDKGGGRFCSLKCVGESNSVDGRGANNSNWKGGRNIDSDGYIRLLKPNHPNANKQGYVGEHVFVMSKKLGRPLRKGEIPHHKNEDRKDNRIENLKLMSNVKHLIYHRKLAEQKREAKR